MTNEMLKDVDEMLLIQATFKWLDLHLNIETMKDDEIDTNTNEIKSTRNSNAQKRQRYLRISSNRKMS